MSNPTAPCSFILTVVANREEGNLSNEAIDAARNLVQGEAPVVLSEGEAVDIACRLPAESSPSADGIRMALAKFKVDALLTRKRGRRKAIFTSDMDSTALIGETPEAIIKLRNRMEELVQEIAEATEKGESFEERMRRHARLMVGTTEEELQSILDALKRTPHLETVVRTMKAKGAVTALISGGFDWFADRVAKELGFDHAYANKLVWKTRKLSGSLVEPVQGPGEKEKILLELCKKRGVQTSAALAVGDGTNDIPMLQTAGLGVAWHAESKVKMAIPAQINFSTMRTLLFAQGYRESDFITN